jgi:hypothetical protein
MTATLRRRAEQNIGGGVGAPTSISRAAAAAAAAPFLMREL